LNTETKYSAYPQLFCSFRAGDLILLKQSEREALKATELMDSAGKKGVLGKRLSLANRKRLEIGVTFATKPKMLLVEEAITGLPQKLTQPPVGSIPRIRMKGITSFL
jgi:branched-chain amino acid transport system ATP-binding protein